MQRMTRQALLSWVSVGLLAVLGCVLAVLQYRWIGEVSRAEHDRLRDGLQEALNRLSHEFDSEVGTACRTIQAPGEQIEQLGRQAAYAARYAQWAGASRHRQIVGRVALAIPREEKLALEILDLASMRFAPADWPEGWVSLRDRLMSRMSRGAPGPFATDDTALIELPRFGRPAAAPGPREQEWLIVEIDVDYVRDAVLPELLQRYLAGAGKLEYDAEVTWLARPDAVVYQAVGDPGRRIGRDADAAVTLFDTSVIFRRPAPERKGALQAAATPPASGRGRWQLLVRHKQGSLETIVARARRSNLAISAAILALMIGAVAALVRFSRRAQQLAELQLAFVEGVSHELRTPLTVIRTAAFNLKRRFANNPAQVERYGSLIEQESEKLTTLVEQVLRFGSARAGRVVREREPVSVENVIEEGIESSRAALERNECLIETNLEPGLPLVLADGLALKQAVQNLVDNAVKYGTEGSRWIGVSAAKVPDGDAAAVEIRVTDRGPGIPKDEQERIFDPFFRGRRALEDQIHGTGLGLNLVKKIVEAHGGTIRVRSGPAGGAEFVMRIPAAPSETQDEFANSVG